MHKLISCKLIRAGLCTTACLFSLSLASFLFLTSSLSFADNDTVVDDVSITVPTACTFNNGITGDATYTASVNPGNTATLGSTTFTTLCNDPNGYSIYAIGYSNNEFGNTEMISSLANPGTSGTATGNIITGTAISGNTSNWMMRLTAVDGANKPTILGGFDSENYHNVPSTYTKVATFGSNTSGTTGSQVQSNYKVYVSPTQAAATYTGKVKYTMVHPSTAEAPTQPQPSTAGCISYWPNASGVTDTMGNQCSLG
ncbi:hypothetical protein IJG01_01720, partial [Candidatus Saccharibacteria bacterium]|nr:hypothetical protein [Candidatus Saccharibacteria bacterium]